MGASGRSRRAPVVDTASRRVGVVWLCRQGERLVRVLGEMVSVMA